MPPGEILITCPGCGHRASVPVAAVKRNNYYCGGCFEKVPLAGIRPSSDDDSRRPQPVRAKKSSKVHRR